MKKFDYFIGIDVSKLKLDVTVLSKIKENKTEVINYQVVGNNEKCILSFIKNLKKDKISLENALFCFEDTGIYSMPLACVLSEQKLDFWQVAALEIKRSKGICRGKTDKSDSKDIAFYALANLHKLRLSKVSSIDIQQLKLLFSEREKIMKSLKAFEKTSENKDFCPKDVFKSVEKFNQTIVNQLDSALKNIEEKMLEILTKNQKLTNQFNLLTSIKGIGKFTAIYLIISTKGFEKFENWGIYAKNSW